MKLREESLSLLLNVRIRILDYGFIWIIALHEKKIVCDLPAPAHAYTATLKPLIMS